MEIKHNQQLQEPRHKVWVTSLSFGAENLLFGYLLIQTPLEVFFHAAHCHPVLGPLWPAHIGHHGAQVDLNHLHKVRMSRLYKSSLLLCCHDVYVEGQRPQHWVSPYLRILGVFWGVFVTSEKLHGLHVVLQQFKFFLGKIWGEGLGGGGKCCVTDWKAQKQAQTKKKFEYEDNFLVSQVTHVSF